MEFYYQRKNPIYKVLPKFDQDCLSEEKSVMDFIYPKESIKVFLPKDFNEQRNDLVFRLAHSIQDIKVFWYLDANFIGTTQTFHEMAILPKTGKHTITVIDELGNELKRNIEITE